MVNVKAYQSALYLVYKMEYSLEENVSNIILTLHGNHNNQLYHKNC